MLAVRWFTEGAKSWKQSLAVYFARLSTIAGFMNLHMSSQQEE
jgi:hypothetical protein